MRLYIFILCDLFWFFIAPFPSWSQQVQANFSSDPPNGCGQLIVQFKDESTGNPSKWDWDFGNGGHSVLQNPVVSYTGPGIYTVTLTASNGVSQSTYSSVIKVYANPAASFSLNPPSGCYPLTVQFTDSSTAGTGNIASRNWDFGDGSPFSTNQNPSHVYDSAGTFSIKLSVVNTAGCASSASNTVVTDQGVMVNFSADKTFSCSAPSTVQFTATTSSNQNIAYQWDFGDGSVGAGKTIAHTFTQKGNYTITLTAAAGNGGCQNQVIKKGYINVGNYTSDFVVPRGCDNTPLTFQNSSGPLPQSATWTFSDGTALTGINAVHQFKVAGTYRVTLVNDFGGCTQSVTKSVTSYPSPTPDFQVDTQHYCGEPVPVNFHNLSQGAVSWEWRFGDGDSSIEQQPVHTYQSDGYFDITLIATSSNGCTDSIVKPKYIHVDAPSLQFAASPGFGCVPLPTVFSLPAASAGEIASYDWDFGDGTAHATDAVPPHIYSNAGTYTVSLQVTTQAGCKLSFSRDNYIHTSTKPAIDFAASAVEICQNSPVQFTNKSQPSGNLWIWTFPNDNNNTDTVENPLYQFHTLGPQGVTLTVSDNGCVASLTKSNFIMVEPPKASFFAKSISCSSPYQFQFTDKSAGAQSWQWNFGDSGASSQENPSHTYQARGVYRVILTVSNGSCSSSDTGFIRVIDEHPQLAVSTSTICHGDSVTLSVGAFQSKHFENSLIWYNGSGDSAYINNIIDGPNQYTFRYENNGQFKPSLKISYVNGCYDSVPGPPVMVRGPIASFTLSQNTICQGNRVTFNSNSQADPSSATIQQWIWNYSDGTADTTASGSVTHAFATNGQFNVNLKITDANGCSGDTMLTGNKALTVNPSKASFSALDTLACPGSVIQWNNSSQGTGITYLWNFGDGTVSTVPNPTGKSYSRDSAYTVSLKINTDKGCSDSLVRPGYIHVGTPHAIMADSLPVAICRIYQDTAISLSKNYIGIRWDFGDGTTSSQDTAYHIYNMPGTYTQKLIVKGYSSGCMDTAARTVTIAGPIGAAVLDDSTGCSPLTVNFSTKDAERVVWYQWFFGNGISSDPSRSGNAAYTYNQQGLFHPTLKLTDGTGCYVIIPIKDSLNVRVDSIGVQPTYSFPSVCDSNRVQFDYNGTIFSADSLKQPASYHWDFGDPATLNSVSDSSHPSYHYNNQGVYNAVLKITTQYGCASTIPFTVNIPALIPLKVMATTAPGAICAGKSVLLQASSNTGVRYVWSPVQGLTSPDSSATLAMPDSTTTYAVTAYSLANCQADTASVNVVVHNIPRVSAGKDQVAATGSVVQLQAAGSNDIQQWNWVPSDYLSCANCSNPTSTPKQNMTYTVTGTTAFGCSSTDSMHIYLICDEGKVFIPNTFTPNGDGINDIFYPRGSGVKLVLYFRIYNRFGQLVYERTNFQLNDKSAGWNGAFKGQLPDPGVFVYNTAMICDNNQVFKLSGNVTLLR